MNMPLARKIYWNASLVIMVLMYAGQYRRHGAHGKHYARCECMMNCLFCALDALRGHNRQEK